MRILVGMMHPKHVYMFKNFIRAMTEKGHKVEIVAIDKDLTERLLTDFQLPYTNIGKNPSSILGKIMAIPQWAHQTYRIARRFEPDLFIGQAFPHFAYVSALLKKPYIIFEDTESAHAVQAITFPFASSIVTPSCYKEHLGGKHVRFNGFFELAYLHPEYFTPDPSVLDEIGLAPGDRYIIVRFVSWEASHDVGQHGIRDKVGLVKMLEQYGRVLITSEGALPPELKPYQIRVSPEKLHDLLYYATLYVGEGGTTAAEAAVLGTPSVYISSLVGKMGNFIDLEENYGALYSFTDESAALSKMVKLLENTVIKDNWRSKREQLLEDKIDVTSFMIWFIENYPRSFTEMKAPNNK